MVIDVEKALKKKLPPAEQFDWQACNGEKKNYAKRDAEQTVNYLRCRRLNPQPLLRAYYCDTCQAWHITSKSK
jgi:hypothetical protein